MTSTGPTAIDPLHVLGLAIEHLDAGRYADVEACVDAASVDLGPAGDALRMTARGLRLESEGRMDEAMTLMERATALDIALPGVLRPQALFFERHGRKVTAHHLSLSLDLLDPTSLPAHFEVIPEESWARHAPRVIRRRLEGHEPMTYEVAPLKQALAETIGPAAATIVLAGMDDGGGWSEPAVRPLVPLIDYARVHGDDFEEWASAAGVPSTAPRVFEQAQSPMVDPPTRAFFTAVIGDVTVTSRSNVLLVEGAALLDVQGDELSRVRSPWTRSSWHERAITYISDCHGRPTSGSYQRRSG